MSMTDPIADMLTRIRNAAAAGHKMVDIPASGIKASIAEVRYRKGFIRGFRRIDDGRQGILRVYLAYRSGKPMINFSPKANLRLPASYSTLADFTSGKFQEVIDDAQTQDGGTVKRVLFCTGKIYFELAEYKAKENRSDVAIVRLEQLYPLPQKQLDALQQKYSKAVWFWVQEEPLNMGAASFLKMNLTSLNFGVISRQASASTATGYAKTHKVEQEEIIKTAFSI